MAAPDDARMRLLREDECEAFLALLDAWDRATFRRTEDPVMVRTIRRSLARRRARSGRGFVVALATLALALAVGCSDAASEPTVTGEELAARIAAGEAPLVLDVRTPEEFATGRVPGALNIPHTELSGRLDELGPDAREREVVVYCQSGARAAVAEDILRGAGFSDVRHLEGDMTAWRSEQRPCEGC